MTRKPKPRYDNLAGRPGDLGLRVTTIGELRIAGLPGVFKPRVWDPADRPPHPSRTRPVPGSARDRARPGAAACRCCIATRFSRRTSTLGRGRFDVLVSHEAPSSHPHGFAVIDALAEACGACLIVHGHHHQVLRSAASEWHQGPRIGFCPNPGHWIVFHRYLIG